jgi:DNA polymerase V
MTAFALLDCNNFYASVERVFDATLLYRPVVVLSNNDGCVIARSQEAKDLGIAMAAPVFKVADVLKQHNVAVRSANFELYGDMSARVMELLQEFTPGIEIYSIDEAFLTVDPNRVPLEKLGREIRDRVKKCTGLPVSVGFAKTKTLAKLANRLAKRSKTAGNVVDLYNDSDIESALAATPVEAVWGVGHRCAKKLKKRGIMTALALQGADLGTIRKMLSVLGARMVMELRGTVCYPLTLTPDELAARRAVTCSRSFSRTVTEKKELREAVSLFLTRAAERMRRLGFAAGALTVAVSSDRFKTAKGYYSNAATYTSAVPSDANLELLRWALDCLEKIYHPDFGYKRLGIILSDLVPFTEANARLIDEDDCRRRHDLMAAIDRLNRRWGRDTVTSAQLMYRKRWHGLSEERSPCYTTRFEDVMRIS